MTLAALRLRPPFLKDSAISSGRRETGSMTSHPVSRIPQVHGSMYQDYVTHQNGTIVMLQASWTRGGVRIRDGAVLLRLRREAALLNVTAMLPHSLESQIGDRMSVFEGRADLLSPDEAAMYKVGIPRRFVDNFFDLEEVEECFIVTQVSAAIADRPEVSLVATAEGVVVREVQAAPTRRMNLKKRT
jgi:hypothetical protein